MERVLRRALFWTGEVVALRSLVNRQGQVGGAAPSLTRSTLRVLLLQMRRVFFKLGTTCRLLAGILMITSLAGCSKKSGEAVVLEKEHIAVAEVRPTPTAAPAPSPTEPTPIPSELDSDVAARPLAEDEIVVDTYVMKKDVRGTSRDPRAISREQWLVKVQVIGGPRFNVHADRAQFDKVKVGDRIKVSYRQGKYTGTVWSTEMD